MCLNIAMAQERQPTWPGFPAECRNHHPWEPSTVTVSSDQLTLALNLPAGFDLSQFSDGQEVLATFAQQPDGTLLLVSLAGDDGAAQANDPTMQSDDGDQGGGGGQGATSGQSGTSGDGQGSGGNNGGGGSGGEGDG